jgi:hypothetical protein
MNKLQRNPNVRWRREVDEVCLYIAKSREMKRLNNVGASVWELCDGTLDLIGIINEVAKEFNVDSSEIKDDIKEFVYKLIDLELVIEVKNEKLCK